MSINPESPPVAAILILNNALSRLARAKEAETIEDATENIAKAKEAVGQFSTWRGR
jgi:hypothetical protein